MAVSRFGRADTALVDSRDGPLPVAEPLWARWNSQLEHRYTLGIEEEVMLLDPHRWSLVQCSEAVIAGLSDELAPHTSPETHAAVVELMTGVHPTVDGVVEQLFSLRNRLAVELRAMGLTAATAGSHPLTTREATKVSGTARYRMLEDTMRSLTRRGPTLAMHVHVGVPVAEDAIRLLNALRLNAPILLALSTNSPFWQGQDGGFSSARTVMFQAFPRTGLPRFFHDYADYVEAVDAVISSGAVPDPSFLWWDVRLQPALGTVEVRVMDAQSMVRDAAPLVALIQSLARLELEGDPPSAQQAGEVLAENRFLAARDGMNARLIDPTARRLIPVQEMLETLVADCRPHALALGCLGALDRVPVLAAANGADRQRAFAADNGSLEGLVAALADQFLAPDLLAATAGRRT